MSVAGKTIDVYLSQVSEAQGTDMSNERTPPTEAPLDSWKAIAAYLGREVRTVMRWPRQLPPIGGNVLTQDVKIALRVSHLEVPMIGRQPAVDNFGDLDHALSESEPPRRLLSTIAGMALDIHCRTRGCFSRHVLPVTARADASALVLVAVVFREPRAAADLEGKDVEACLPFCQSSSPKRGRS
jgi:hypothetical protein